MARSKCFFDITVGGTPAGRIVFELYDDVVPKTAANFASLCKGGKTSADGVEMTYKGCPFHRVIPKFMLQGGDFTKQDGTGGVSIYGAKFKDEDFSIKHSRPGLLSMANCGPDTNGSQFFISTVPNPHLDGKHVVFGEVTKGMSTVRAVEGTETANGDKPKLDCVIADCGVIAEGEDDGVPAAVDGDDWQYDPADARGLKTVADFLDAAQEIRVKGNDAYKKSAALKGAEKNTELERAAGKYRKALRYIEAAGADQSLTEEQAKQISEAKIPCYSNASTMYLKLQDKRQAMAMCQSLLVLDPNHTKGLYRRATIYSEQLDFEDALKDTEHALSITPDDRDLQKLSKDVRKKANDQKTKERQQYSKMFN